MENNMDEHLDKAGEFLRKGCCEAALVRLGLAKACAEESGSELPSKYFEIKRAASKTVMEKALYKAKKAMEASYLIMRLLSAHWKRIWMLQNVWRREAG